MQAEIPTAQEKLTQKWIRQQNAIGWRHIAFGRMATALTETISSVVQEQGIETWLVSGEKWTRRLIQTIWDTFLQLWQNRNNILYSAMNGNIMDRRRERLIAKVDRCLQKMDQLTTEDRNRIFIKNKDDLMKDNPRFIAAWLKLAERIIRVNKRDQANHRQESHLMENYFQWKPSTNATQKRRKVCHQKNDLKPD
jgi:hypothetical protein